MVNLFWQIFYSDSADLKSRRSSLILLTMMAKTKKEIIEERLDVVLNVGLGSLGTQDPLTAKYSCIALQRLVEVKKTVKGSWNEYPRLPWSHNIFSKLISFLDDNCNEEKWFGVVEQGINTIYMLADMPDKICGEFIKDLVNETFNLNGGYDLTQVSSDDINLVSCCKLLFVVGHVAIKQIVHLEYIESQWKKQQSKKNETNEKPKPQKGAPLTPLRQKRLSVMPNHNNNADELEQVSGTADDDFADLVFYVREHELLNGKTSLLTIFTPLIQQICANDKTFNVKNI